MTLLHTIIPTGIVTSEEYTGPLEYAAPPFATLRKMISGPNEAVRTTIEHVNVLWKGKHAHMFVDEDGLAKCLPLNHKASRIYGNNMVSRERGAKSPLIYNDLQKPAFDYRFDFDTFHVVGVAVLWEGDIE